MDSPPGKETPAPASAPDDGIAEMTRGLRRSDAAAWETFHRRYYLALLRVANSRAPSIDPETAVQAAYLRVARHIKPFRDEADFWRWLCCLLRCAVADLQRERTRTHRLLERFHLWTELWRSRNFHPARTDLADALEEALQTLDGEDAALLQRKYGEGWSTAELARAGDCSEKAIESRLARLRARLKDQLAGGSFHA